MRGRQWKTFAIATVAAMTFAACAGEGEDADGAEMEDAPPAAETDAGAPAAAQPGGQQEVNLPEGVTQAAYDQGRQLFTSQGGCHACHGPQATGTQLAPDLTDSEWINVSGPNLEEVVELIKTGVPQPVEHPAPMPPMGGASLSDDQVEALAAYVVTLGQG